MATGDKLPPQKIQVDRHEALTMTWRDGEQSVYPILYLRQKCPCATCRDLRDNNDPFRVLDNAPTVPDDLHVTNVSKVGHYALQFQFSDGHGTGIYSYQYLQEIARADTEAGRSE